MTKQVAVAIEVHPAMSATAKIHLSKWNMTGARVATGSRRGYANPALSHPSHGPQA